MFKNYSLTLSSFQSLSLVTFNNLYWQSDSQNLEMNEQYQKVDFAIEQIEITITLLAVPALLTFFGSIAYELKEYLCRTDHGKGQTFLTKARKRLYHGFTFPFSLGFITPFLLANFSLSLVTTPFSFYPQEVVSLLCLVIACVTSVVLGLECLRVTF